MIKLVTIIGARPQIIKASALSRAIMNHFPETIQETILHTGQHYDNEMSRVFFEELNIPSPQHNLNVGSRSHGKQTADMTAGIEEFLIENKPDAVILYGDTNSTLAGAISACKLHFPVVHIEAGLRSFNKKMPEEINRIVCDHCSTLLFTPTQTGLNNLIREGFTSVDLPPYSIDHPGVFHCGDIMFDNSLFFSDIALQRSDILKKQGIDTNEFILITIHRDNNTDNQDRLTSIIHSLIEITEANNIQAVFPLHPRTSGILKLPQYSKLRKMMEQSKYLKLLPPVSFLDMIVLEKNAKLIMTDSGGVQKEAFFFKKPCIILRAQTEWVEIVNNGTAMVTDADGKKITDAYQHFARCKGLKYPSTLFGNGKASEFICKKLIETFAT